MMPMSNRKNILKTLSPECVEQIRKTLANRPRELLSNTMSEEARMAMKMAAEDARRHHRHSRRHEKRADDKCNNSKDKNQTKSWTSHNEIENTENGRKQPSYTEMFQKNGTVRLDGDITDANYSENKVRKRAVGGGRIESAMETIVLINADDPNDIDDIAIEETAKLNSVEKCLVWMELHDVDEMAGRASPITT